MQNLDEIVRELTESLLPSQQEFILAPEVQRAYGSGFRAGKTVALCRAAVLLSYFVPNNSGFIGRAVGKDLQQTTFQTFMDEVCPPELIVGRPRKVGSFGQEVYLRTNKPPVTAKIYFDHIVDRQTGRFHLAGGNWGWCGTDQGEEIERSHHLKLISRLSRNAALKKNSLTVFNQQGHNWIWEDFYQGGDYIFDPIAEPALYWKAVRKNGRLGVVSRSEENRVSNGGFVEDSFFDEMRRTYPPEWIARYLDSSFDDFSGKICPSFTMESVHNIEPFDYPAHWPTLCIIDPGGSSPWGCLVIRIDEFGNLIITGDAPPLAERRLNPVSAIRWLKSNLNVARTRFVIDYSAAAIAIQLQGEGIHCEPANKDVQASVTKLASYCYVLPDVSLPDWYLQTQPAARIAKFRDAGAPKIYFVRICERTRKQMDAAIWDAKGKNVPAKETESFRLDQFDCARYACMAAPQPAIPPAVDPFASIRKIDVASAESAAYFDRYWKNREQQRDANASPEYEDDSGGLVGVPSFVDAFELE